MSAARALLWIMLLALAGSGCRVVTELVESDTDTEGNPDAATSPDATPTPGADARPNTDCTPWAFEPDHVSPCDAPAPTGNLSLTAGEWIYDTNSGALLDPNSNASFPTSTLLQPQVGPELRALVADAVDIPDGAILRVIGKRPLIVIAWSTIDVAGTINLTSSTEIAAAGADHDGCATAAATPGGDNVDGAGGGGGGGYGSAGADGGHGLDGAGTAGTAGGMIPRSGIRGGCPGGAGGNVTGGTAGHGGGAIQLLAQTSVTIRGVVTAGGTGGGPARGGRAGGGGGGSGGYIGVQAPMVSVTDGAVVAANGGGGGGGSDNDGAIGGESGAASATPAAGGDGQGMGKPGGAGAAVGAAAVAGTDSGRGGGGGGGGVGYIVLTSPSLDVHANAIVSPDAMSQ
jgi:hypothetical protein